ncbi:MAG: tetratricopeptide repeat protein [Pirellulales bacterium]
MAASFRSQSPLRLATFVVAGGAVSWLVFWVASEAWFVWRMDAAQSALEAGNVAQARVGLEQLDRWRGPRGDVHFLLAVAHRRGGSDLLAEKYLTSAARYGWPEFELAQQRALLAARRGDTQAAESLLSRLMRDGASDLLAEDFYQAISEGYIKSYRLKEAWRSLVFWSEWKKTAARPRLLKAAISERVGDLPGAIDEYRTILEFAPQHLTARLRYAKALLEQNSVPEALEQYETLAAQQRKLDAASHSEVLRADEVDEEEFAAELGLGRGACLRRLGRTAEAREQFQELAQRKLPRDQRITVQVELGELDLAAGRYEESIARLAPLVDEDPSHGRLHFALARAYQLAKRAPEAEHHRKIHADLRRKSDRLHEVTRQLIESPQDADLRYEAAMLLREQGRETDARGWLLSILRIEPQHRAARAALAASTP